MAQESPPPGATSEVHTSLLEPVMLFNQVPYTPGIAVILAPILLAITNAAVTDGWWKILLLIPVLYGLLFVLTKDDHQLIEIAVRALLYADYYGDD